MLSKLRISEWLTAIGVALLFGATFRPWFEVPVSDEWRPFTRDTNIGDPPLSLADGGGQLNVWDLTVTRWLIYGALLACAWMVIAALFGETPRWAVVLNTPALLLSACATLGLVVRLINPPAGANVLAAYWPAVVGGALMLVGSAWALRDDSVPAAYRQAPPPERLHA